MQSAIHEFCAEVLNKHCLLNTEYKNGGIDCVSLCHADSKDDIAQLLISEGWLLVEARREKRLAKLVSQYQKAQENAKEGRVSTADYLLCLTLLEIATRNIYSVIRCTSVVGDSSIHQTTMTPTVSDGGFVFSC